MGNFVEVMKTEDLKDGEMKGVKVREREIMLSKVEGRFFATDNSCPHMGGKLAQGKLEGTVVTCPKHGSQFNIRDGRVIRWTDWSGFKLGIVKRFKPPKPIATYPVKVEKGKVLVEI